MSIVASITVAWQNVRDESIGGLKTIETDIASDNQGSPPTFSNLDGAIDRAREVLDFARSGTNDFIVEDQSKLARAHITLHPGNYVLTNTTSASDFQNSSSGNDDVFVTALPGARIDDTSANFNVGDSESVIADMDSLTRVLFNDSTSTFSIFEELIVEKSSTFKGSATFEDQANFQSPVSFSDTITIQGSDVDEVTSNPDNSSNTALVTASAIDGAVPTTTNDLAEGASDLYFTQDRVFQTLRDGDFNSDTADPNTSGVLQSGTDITLSVDDNNNTITIELDGDLDAVAPEVQDDGASIVPNTDVFNFTGLLNVSGSPGIASISVSNDVFDTTTNTSDDVTEGSTNLFFTDSRVFSANQSQIVGGDNINVVEDVANEQLALNFVGVEGSSVSDNGSQILAEPSDVNFGSDLEVIDDGDGTVTINFTGNLEGSTVEDSTTTIQTSASVFNFASLLDVTSPTTGQVDVSVNDDLSLYDNSNSDFITGLNVDDSGVDVNTAITNLNFGSNLTVTDDGGGTITINGTGGTDTRANISDGGSQVLTNVTDINFDANLSVTDDGDGSVTVSGSGSSDTRTDVSDDGSEVVSNTDDINFTGDVQATSDGDGSVTVELENNTVTVAGNTASLGGSATIAITDLSDVGLDGDNRLQFSDLPSISTSTSPSKDSDLATKVYVDGVAQGLDLKESVRAATDETNIDLTANADPNPIDGVVLSDGDRVLLKDQNATAENGIYVANTATDPTTWTRSEDADEDDEVTSGTFTFVEEGTANINTSYIITTSDPITVDSTAINWSQFSAAGQIDAGSGLVKTGQTLNVALPVNDGGTSVGSGFDLNFGSNLSVTDDGGGAFTIDASGGTNVSDDGSQVVTNSDDINFGANLTVTDDNDGSVTVDAASGTDTRTNVSDSGSQVVANTNDINFAANLTVTDDADGSVTVAAASSTDTTTNISDDGVQVVTQTDDINFTGNVQATSDGDSSATVDLENDAVTVAGNTASLGGSTTVALIDLSDVGLDEDNRPQFSDLPSIATTTTPSKSSDFTTKAYVDGVAQGLDLKESVRAATDGTSIDLTADTDPNPVDGVTLSDGDRVLLKDQSTAAENGVYVAKTAIDPTTWIRSADADENNEITSGTFAFVEEGTTNGDSSYIVTTPDPISVGTTSINWSQFSAAGEIGAGSGLTKTGQTLNVVLPIDDSGANVGTGFNLNFGTNLTVTDDGSGTFTIDGVGNTDTSTNVSDDGVQIVADTTDINFGANLTVTDDNDGSVTIDASGSSDTRTNVSDDGVQVVSSTDDINFGTELDVVNDGDGSVTIEATYSVEAQDDERSLTTAASIINFNDLLEASVNNTDEVEVNGVDTVKQARGTATFSGDGSTTQFTITHGLGYVPRQWFIEEVTDDGSNVSHTTADANTLTINYDTAPTSGTNNVIVNYATDLKRPDAGGQVTLDGDGVATQFTIPHGLPEVPSEWFVEAATEDARGIAFTDADATNIIVNYDTPPASGTDNVVLNYAAFLQEPNTFSGNGVKTQFQIPHGFNQTPNDWHVEPITEDASGFFHTTADSTFITVNYGTAPPSGTNNVKFRLDARS